MTQRISWAVLGTPFFAGLIAVIFTFSACSSDDGGDDTPEVVPKYLYCAYYATSSCAIGPMTQEACVGGIPMNDCPAGFSKGGAGAAGSSSSSSRLASSSSVGPHGSLVYGGKTYKTVKIGEQTWMAENLNYISGGASSASGVRCYSNDALLCGQFGRLYNWSAAMNVHSDCSGGYCVGEGQHRGICPSGWHIPSKSDWDILRDKAGGVKDAGKHLKAKDNWNKFNGKNGNGEDTYNFLALPGGFYEDEYEGIDFHGYWWIAEENKSDSHTAGTYSAHYSSDSLIYKVEVKSNYFSIRCIQD